MERYVGSQSIEFKDCLEKRFCTLVDFDSFRKVLSRQAIAMPYSNSQGGGSAAAKNEYAAKIAKILQVLDEPNVDLWKLRGLALSEGGLVNGTLWVFKRWCFFLRAH